MIVGLVGRGDGDTTRSCICVFFLIFCVFVLPTYLLSCRSFPCAPFAARRGFLRGRGNARILVLFCFDMRTLTHGRCCSWLCGFGAFFFSRTRNLALGIYMGG
jgi:hypothetical protein